MAKKTYAELLKDPRWQRKRLEMLESAGFRCESCGDTEEELHIHHVYYERDIMPWDYHDYVYMVLCTKCHNKWHKIRSGIDMAFCKMGIEQLHHVMGMVTMFKMMGPNVTRIFFDLVSGYHIRQFKDDSESSDF